MNNEILGKIKLLIEPIVEKCGYELYHLEFVREDGENYLRVYIDKDPVIILDDCIKVNKVVSEMLDIEDPIEESYYLEISSPGIERVLHNDKHLQRYLESKVVVKLENLIKGKKKLEGILKGFDDKSIQLEFKNEVLSLSKDNIITISLKGEY